MRSEKRSAIVVVDGQKKKIVYDKVVNYQEAEDGGVLRKSYGIRLRWTTLRHLSRRRRTASA